MKNLNQKIESIHNLAVFVESENPAIGRIQKSQDIIFPMKEKGKILFFNKNKTKGLGIYLIVVGELREDKKTAELVSKAHKIYLQKEVFELSLIMQKSRKKSFIWLEGKIQKLILSVQERNLPPQVELCFLERIQIEISNMNISRKKLVKLTDYLAKKIIQKNSEIN